MTLLCAISSIKLLSFNESLRASDKKYNPISIKPIPVSSPPPPLIKTRVFGAANMPLSVQINLTLNGEGNWAVKIECFAWYFYWYLEGWYWEYFLGFFGLSGGCIAHSDTGLLIAGCNVNDQALNLRGQLGGVGGGGYRMYVIVEERTRKME